MYRIFPISDKISNFRKVETIHSRYDPATNLVSSEFFDASEERIVLPGPILTELREVWLDSQWISQDRKALTYSSVDVLFPGYRPTSLEN